MESWYSDAALEKQARLDAQMAAGEPPKWSDMLGLLEPRVQPLDDERCRHCRMDARVESGGDAEFCGLCLDRGKDEDYR